MLIFWSLLLLLLTTSRLCDGQYSNCSSSYRSSSGTITSPNYPRNYNSNSNCTYTVSAATSGLTSISFTIRDLNLESGSNCRYDWVEIGCRSHSVAVPVRYCGTGSYLAPVVFAPCTQGVVLFRSDGSATFSGFSLDFRVTPIECGDNCTLRSNSFGYKCDCDNSSTSNESLPSLPPQPSCIGGCSLYSTPSSNSYPYCYCLLYGQRATTPTTTCSPGCYYDYDFYGQRYCRCTQMTTAIQCPYGCTRRTDWRGDTSCDCSTDQTSVPCPYGCYYDRDFWGYRYCNCPASTQPPIWCSPGCTSDVNVYGERYCRCPSTTTTPCYSPCYYQYNYTYDYYGSRYCYCPPTTTQPPPTGCGESYSSASGIITSPNYPNAYPKGIDCYQYITVPMATSMTLQILDVNIYYSSSYSCYYEYVEITGCDNRVVSFCTRETIPSSGLSFHCIDHTTTTILFHSYSSSYYYSSYRGFKLSYRTSFVSNCNETNSYLSQGRSGVITSPNFPNDFPGHSECFNYLFTDDDDTLIKIMFDQLRLGNSQTCQNVFLEFSCHDNVHLQNHTICGSVFPQSLTFDCKTLRIWFKSNSLLPPTPRHFKLKYMAIRKTVTTNTSPAPTQRSSGEVDPRLSASGPDPWKLGLALGAGVGGFLFLILIVLIVVISVCYRRQLARQERRHFEELATVCTNLRTNNNSSNNSSSNDGNVTFSTAGGSDVPSVQYYRSSSGPPPYTPGGARGHGSGDEGGGGGGGGRGGGESYSEDGFEATSDDRMLLA